MYPEHSRTASGKGPREFIVPTSEQVYPEFILELKAWCRLETMDVLVLQNKTEMGVLVPWGTQVYPKSQHVHVNIYLK